MHCRREDDTVRAKTGHQPSYDVAKNDIANTISMSAASGYLKGSLLSYFLILIHRHMWKFLL